MKTHSRFLFRKSAVERFSIQSSEKPTVMERRRSRALRTPKPKQILAYTSAAVLALGLLALSAQAAQPPANPPAASAPVQQTPPGEDILDIRGPIHIPAPFPWFVCSAGAAVAAGLGFATWKWFRRTRRKLPYEIALEKLEATRPLMEHKIAEPFSIAVSEIVRLFIEECLPLRAAHRTTNEFLHDLVTLRESPLAAHREVMADFLEHCDLAKFACWSLTRPQMEAMLASARAFILALGRSVPSTPPSRQSEPASTREPVTAAG